MKLLVPHTGSLQAADARLVRLAQFLGISCEFLLLGTQIEQRSAYLENAAPNRNCCLVINPRVISDWLGCGAVPADLVSCLVSQFPYLLVHAVTLDSRVPGILASLSGGAVPSVQAVADAGQPYEIPITSKDVCASFSGLSFGPISAANDRVFGIDALNGTVRSLIRIAGQPFMVALRRGATEMLCLGSEDVADMDAHAGYSPLDSHFSRFMPHAIALRYIFGEECWHPAEAHASIIVDDPLLRPKYGFLNFDTLLHLMKAHSFHTSVAFIPHNYRRNSERVLRLFRDNPRYLSICYHGNDHTQSEFASRDIRFLSAAVSTAEKRMGLLHRRSQLRCDRVMVFPQSDFSLEAMHVLRSTNFHGAVSSAWHPLGKPALPTLRDICQPAILHFGGFPLFGRNCARDTRSQDVAFNVFFGRPTLTGEHHDTFKNPNDLVEAAQRINSFAPRISWSNLETALSGSYLRRRGHVGRVQIRPYSPTVTIANRSAACERLSILWDWSGNSPQVERVLRNGLPFAGAETSGGNVRVEVDLAPEKAESFSVVCRSGYPTTKKPGWRWAARVFVRRRLSEARDNYLSRHRQLGRLAMAVQRRLLA